MSVSRTAEPLPDCCFFAASHISFFTHSRQAGEGGVCCGKECVCACVPMVMISRCQPHLQVPFGAVACRRRVSFTTESSTGSLVKSALP